MVWQEGGVLDEEDKDEDEGVVFPGLRETDTHRA